MTSTPPAPPTAWENVATPEDVARLTDLSPRWRTALAAMRGRRPAADAALLDPDAQPRALLPPGPYRCRTLRLGEAGQRGYRSAGAGFCYVGHEGDLLSLTRQGGRERPGGYLWVDGRDRMVFLGAFAVGREALPPAYRDRPERNLVGVVERIGPFHYRLVLLRAQAGRIDVVELVPALTG